MDGRIVSHHIGGRYGNGPFPVLRDLERDFVNVLYDADADCVRQMKRANEDLESKLYMRPKTAADRHPRIFPPTFAELYSAEESVARFSADAFVSPITASMLGARAEAQPDISHHADSPVEKLLRKHNLGRQADTIKSVRIEQT